MPQAPRQELFLPQANKIQVPRGLKVRQRAATAFSGRALRLRTHKNPPDPLALLFKYFSDNPVQVSFRDPFNVGELPKWTEFEPFEFLVSSVESEILSGCSGTLLSIQASHHNGRSPVAQIGMSNCTI